MNSLSQILGTSALKPWEPNKPVKQGAVVLSPADNYQAYVRIGATGAGATDPASDTTNFRPFGGRAIKSIQRGELTITSGTTGSATIAAVNMAKAVVTHLGGMVSYSTSSVDLPRLALTSPTTLVATARGSLTSPMVVGYQVVEYY